MAAAARGSRRATASTSDDDQDDAGRRGFFHSGVVSGRRGAAARGAALRSLLHRDGRRGVVPFSSRSDPGASASALRRSAARKKPGRASSGDVVKLIRVSAFLHAVVMAAFLRLRGTPRRRVPISSSSRGARGKCGRRSRRRDLSGSTGGGLMGRVGRRGLLTLSEGPRGGPKRGPVVAPFGSRVSGGSGPEAHRRGGVLLRRGPEASEALASLERRRISSGSLRDRAGGRHREGAAARRSTRAGDSARGGGTRGRPQTTRGDVERWGPSPGGGRRRGQSGGTGGAGSLDRCPRRERDARVRAVNSIVILFQNKHYRLVC